MCQSSLEENDKEPCPNTRDESWSGRFRTHHAGREYNRVRSTRDRQEYLDLYVEQQEESKIESDVDRQEHDVCWICHDDDEDGQCPLEKICSCPWLRVHRQCLARWQLQQAGKVEEKECRFCGEILPDWREAHEHLPKGRPVMTVVHENVVHQVVVEPGEFGQRKFQQDIRRIFGLQEDDAIQLTFGCRLPDSPHEVTLDGWTSYDAAVHCASLSAGQREKRVHSESPQKKTACQRRKVSSASPHGVLRRLFADSSQQKQTT